MIDTDKYEGHTPAKNWRKTDGSAMSIQSANNNADAELMADAPLLSAEVQRLRDIVCLLEDSRIRGLSIFDRPQLFDDVLQIHTQRNEQGNGDLPPFECVGEEE